jgi:hypothetical protein
MTQLHQRSHSNRGARAGAVFGGAGALPNRPFVFMHWLVILSTIIERKRNVI